MEENIEAVVKEDDKVEAAKSPEEVQEDLVFNKERFVANIQKLAKDRGIKLSELEEFAKVSPGYLSRITNKSSRVMPSIYTALLIANKLGTTVDILLKADLTYSSPNDNYVQDFLNKLISDSQAFQMVWDIETEEAINNIISMRPDDVQHPLFRSYCDMDNCLVAYDSLFHPYESDQKVEAKPPFYHTKINNGKYDLYLARIDYDDELGLDFFEYELYMVDGKGKVQPVCHSMWNVSNEVGRLLYTLYSVAGETIKHVKITKTVRSAIDDFMKSEITDYDDSETEQTPATTDDELPF